MLGVVGVTVGVLGIMVGVVGKVVGVVGSPFSIIRREGLSGHLLDLLVRKCPGVPLLTIQVIDQCS